MPTAAGGIYIDPNGSSAVVQVTTPTGVAIPMFSDVNCANSVVMPATITVRTAFYSQNPEPAASVSVKVGGTEYASPGNKVFQTSFQFGAMDGITLPDPSVLISAPTGTYVPVAGTYATAATLAESTQVTGDTVARFTLGADGKMQWGPGGAGALDTVLQRLSGFVLNVGGGSNLRVDGYVLANGGGGTQISLGVRAGAVTIIDGAAGAGATNMANMALSMGTGAPVNATGNNGDIYVNAAGGAGTTIYQRRAGAWVGIV